MKQSATKLLSSRFFVIVYSSLLVLIIMFGLYTEKFSFHRPWEKSILAQLENDDDEHYQPIEATQRLNVWNRPLELSEGRPFTTQTGSITNQSSTAGDGHDVLTLTSEERTVAELTETLREALERANDAVSKMATKTCRRFDYSSNTYPSHLPCIRAKCKERFNRTLEERVRDVLFSPQYQLSRRQLDAILSLGQDIPEADIIIASAVSSNHFDEMQMMFKNLHAAVFPKLQDFRVVLFDIGLTPEERLQTERECRCQVVTFDLSLFPRHVTDLHCYAWKPLIIRSLFHRARQIVVWQDASVRWGLRFKIILQRARMYGLQVLVTGLYKITANTLHEMFEYMQEKECLFEWMPEICNAVAVYRVDSFNRRAILDPWCSCALNSSCMCPQDPAVTRACGKLRPKRCHRFDQSALSLLLGKLYYDQRYKIEIPGVHKHVEILRGTVAPNYFIDKKGLIES